MRCCTELFSRPAHPIDHQPVSQTERDDDSIRAANTYEGRPAHSRLWYRFTTLCCSCGVSRSSNIDETLQILPDEASHFSSCFQEIDESGDDQETIITKITTLLSKNKKLNELINDKSNNLIMECIERDKHMAATLLIKSLAPRTWVATPMTWAETTNYSALTQKNRNSDTALTLALKNLSHNCMETLETLLTINLLTQFEIADGNNDTPLMLAIKRDNINIIMQIIKKAEYRIQIFEGINNDGLTALMLAVTLQQLDTVNRILESPSFTLALFQQVNPENETALTLARHSPSIQKALLDYANDPGKQENMPAVSRLDLIARLNTNVNGSDSSINGEQAISPDSDVTESSPSSIGPSISMRNIAEHQ